MAKRKNRKDRRSFSREYKAEVVDLVRQSEESISQICRNLDLTESSVRNWIRLADAAGTEAVNRSSGADDAGELARLRAENKQLRMERDILKKATASSRGQRNTSLKQSIGVR